MDFRFLFPRKSGRVWYHFQWFWRLFLFRFSVLSTGAENFKLDGNIWSPNFGPPKIIFFKIREVQTKTILFFEILVGKGRIRPLFQFKWPSSFVWPRGPTTFTHSERLISPINFWATNAQINNSNNLAHFS